MLICKNITPLPWLCFSYHPHPIIFSNDDTQEQDKEEELMVHEQSEQQYWQVQQELEQMPPVDSFQKSIDPSIAIMTHINKPTPTNVPMVQVSLSWEVPMDMDGNLVLLVPVANISVLWSIFSIVVTSNSRDSIIQEMSKLELMKMEYTPTVVNEGKCQGLCSNQMQCPPRSQLQSFISSQCLLACTLWSLSINLFLSSLR